MKKIYNSFKLIVGALTLVLIVWSCVPEPQSMGDAGQTLVKLHPGKFNLVPMDAKTTPQTVPLFEIRRDVPSNAELQKTSTVELKYDTDTTMLKRYNLKNRTNFIPLPTTLGTVSPAITGGKITLTLGANEFSKAIMLNVPNAGNFDFSKAYALAFKLTSVTGTGTISKAVNDTIVVQVLVKNRFDGKYEVTGTFVDYINSAWNGYYPKNVHLQTSGALTVNKYDADYGFYFYIFNTVAPPAVSLSYFGNWTPAFVFNEDNTVAAVVNTTFDPAPRSRTAVLYTGPGAAANRWDPVTKTLEVSYQMRQETASPQLRNLVVEKYVYKGPR